MTASTYLVIGHIALDVANGGYRPGGTATYAAVTASRLGLSVRVMTSAGDGGLAAFRELGVTAEVCSLPSEATTVFLNTYTATGRRQHLLSVAAPLDHGAIPLGWLSTDILHLGPLAQEVDERFLASAQAGTTLGVTPQGWLRAWDGEGAVWPQRWQPPAGQLASVAALVLSLEDVGGDTSLIDYYSRHCQVTVVTEGYRGCSVRLNGERVQLATRPALETDPTGAGDVFAAAYFVRLHETGDPIAAAKFANVAGSFSVEGMGVGSIPTRAVVEAWLAANPDFPWLAGR